MRTISDASGDYLTSDEVATAFAAYDVALRVSGSSDRVEIPIILDDHDAWAELHVGDGAVFSSRTAGLAVGTDSLASTGVLLALDLHDRVARMSAHRAQAFEPDDLPDDWWRAVDPDPTSQSVPGPY